MATADSHVEVGDDCGRDSDAGFGVSLADEVDAVFDTVKVNELRDANLTPIYEDLTQHDHGAGGVDGE